MLMSRSQEDSAAKLSKSGGRQRLLEHMGPCLQPFGGTWKAMHCWLQVSSLQGSCGLP